MSRLTNEFAIRILDMFLHKQCDLGRTKFAYDANTVWDAVYTAREALKELQHYKDLEEQGGLIKPPCFVGDKVYAYCEVFGRILEYYIETIYIGYDTDDPKGYWSFEAMCDEHAELIDEIDFTLDDIGETVFLTKEEAEAKLRELNTHDREKSVSEVAE